MARTIAALFGTALGFVGEEDEDPHAIDPAIAIAQTLAPHRETMAIEVEIVTCSASHTDRPSRDSICRHSCQL
jgi:hypothetical protein